jgi:hypothetical protein
MQLAVSRHGLDPGNLALAGLLFDGGLDGALSEGTCDTLAEAIGAPPPLMRRVARFVEQRAECGLDQRSLPDQFVLEIAKMVVRLCGGRSRQEYWCKGETSGDRQYVRSGYYDCDMDVVLFVVEQDGRGACHTGAHSCFFRAFGDDAAPGRL